MPCDAVSDVVACMRLRAAEAMVFFYGSSPAEIRAVEKHVQEPSAARHGHEYPYMCALSINSGFVFYAQDHQSLEVLGLDAMIVQRCLPFLLGELVSRTNISSVSE
jgi:hypothetical protein